MFGGVSFSHLFFRFTHACKDSSPRHLSDGKGNGNGKGTWEETGSDGILGPFIQVVFSALVILWNVSQNTKGERREHGKTGTGKQGNLCYISRRTHCFHTQLLQGFFFLFGLYVCPSDLIVVGTFIFQSPVIIFPLYCCCTSTHIHTHIQIC